jgi:hypothetical protein
MSFSPLHVHEHNIQEQEVSDEEYSTDQQYEH